MRSRACAAAAAVLALAVPATLRGEPMAIAGYTVDLPAGWRLVDGAEGRLQSFADASDTAVLQVSSFAAGGFASSAEMAKVIGTKLGAAGDAASYLYSGRDATIFDMSFRAGSIPARGYGVFLRGGRTDYALLAFAPAAWYESHEDVLLSALDSFCPDPSLRLAPGPISQFASRFPAERGESRTLSVGGRPVTLATSADERAAGQDLAEREARILAAEKVHMVEAWRRSFRMIYRDSYLRLASFAQELEALPLADAPRGRAEALLAWIQGFRYLRTGTVADLTAPLACLADAAGDCDSRALLYVILLHHLGIDAVLLVSPKYGHSAAGVAVAGPGARITVDGRSYVFAELTAQVALGLVAQDQSDANAWIPVPLGGPAPKP